MMINNNTTIEIIECPICLEILQDSDAIYIVNCCNNKFHFAVFSFH